MNKDISNFIGLIVRAIIAVFGTILFLLPSLGLYWLYNALGVMNEIKLCAWMFCLGMGSIIQFLYILIWIQFITALVMGEL